MSLPCIVTWNELPVSHSSLLLYIFGAITTNAYTLESCYLMPACGYAYKERSIYSMHAYL